MDNAAQDDFTVQEIQEMDDFGLNEIYEMIKIVPSAYSNEIVKAVTHEIIFRKKRGEKIAVYSGKDIKRESDYYTQKFKSGITTGYEELDQAFTFLPQQLYLLSAPSHFGKTTFALNLCAKTAALGNKVLFCSLEQGLYISPRIESILKGEIPDTFSILTSNNILSIQDIVKSVEESDTKPNLVCIDHLHFIEKKGRSTTEAVDSMIIEIQNMAKRLELPVLVLAHTRKLNDNRPPTLDDLRDSSSLGQVPSVVLFLHRKIQDKEDDTQSYLSDYGNLFIAKNRIQGITGARRFRLLPSGEVIFVSKSEGKTQKEISLSTVREIFS